VVVKITTLKYSIHILQHGYIIKVQKSLDASFYDMSSSSVKDVVKHIVISSFYNVVTVSTSLLIMTFTEISTTSRGLYRISSIICNYIIK
jgi:hypothetical protein